MILAAFFIIAAVASLFLESPYDYFEYEPMTADELAEEEAFFKQDVEADAELLEEGQAWARPDGRFL